MLLLQAFNRLSQELACSDCRHALTAVELVLKYLVRPRLPKEPGLGAAAIGPWCTPGTWTRPQPPWNTDTSTP